MTPWMCCAMTLVKYPEYMERRAQTLENGIPHAVRWLVLHVLSRCVRYGATRLRTYYSVLGGQTGIHRQTLSNSTVPTAIGLGLLTLKESESKRRRQPIVLRLCPPLEQYWPEYGDEEMSRMILRVLNCESDDFFEKDEQLYQGGTFCEGVWPE